MHIKLTHDNLLLIITLKTIALMVPNRIQSFSRLLQCPMEDTCCSKYYSKC